MSAITRPALPPGDRPRVDRDDDLLDRAPFVAQLADALLALDASDGLVIALQGPWGAGKTTVINFLLAELAARQQADDERLIVVRFNPWWFSGSDQLLGQFFRQVRAALGKSGRSAQLQAAGKQLERFARGLRFVRYVRAIPGVGGVIGDLPDLAEEAIGQVAETFQAAGEALDADLQGLRDALDETLRGQSARLLVVIDDVDRLRADELQQLFQVVKAVADFPNTIYLLAYDAAVVERALGTVQVGDGAEYLAKIVQLPLTIPLPDRAALCQAFFRQLDVALVGTPDHLGDAHDFGNLYWDALDALLRTPRDFTRLAAVLALRYPLVRGEVNMADFIGLEALRLIAPSAYAFVQAHESDLLRGGRRDEDRAAARRRGEEFLATLPTGQREPVRRLLVRLFPMWGAVFGGTNYDHRSWQATWFRGRRVSSEAAFPIYFRLGLASGAVRAVETEEALGLAGDAAAFAQTLRSLAIARRADGTPRLNDFLARASEGDGPRLVDPVPALTAIFEVGDEIVALVHDADGAPFDPGGRRRLIWLVNALLRPLTRAARFAALEDCLQRGKALELITYFVMVLRREHGWDTGEPPHPAKEWTLAAEQAQTLTDLALIRLREGLRSGVLGNTPPPPFVLGRLIDWSADKDEARADVRAYVGQLIATDAGLARYCAGYLSSGHAWGSTDRVARRQYSIDVVALGEYLPIAVADLLPRIRNILDTSSMALEERQRRALETLVTKLGECVDDNELQARANSALSIEDGRAEFRPTSEDATDTSGAEEADGGDAAD